MSVMLLTASLCALSASMVLAAVRHTRTGVKATFWAAALVLMLALGWVIQ